MGSCARWCCAGWSRRPARTPRRARSCSRRRGTSSSASGWPGCRPCRSWRRSCPITWTTNWTWVMTRPGRNRQPGRPSPGRPSPGQHNLSAADLAKARAAAASLGPGFDDDDWHDAEVAGERDSLSDVPGGVRLQKVLAAAGVGSRRYCEELIGAGRVEVDGEIVRRFGARVDPQRQIIRVDGRRIPASEDLVYLALNKPAGGLTTRSGT